MGWDFQNKNSHVSINTGNTKKTSNNKSLTVPPPTLKFHTLSFLNLLFCIKRLVLSKLLSNTSASRAVNTSARRVVNTSARKVGFTLIETLIGLALVSISGFVVAFVNGQMNTASKLTDESYECAAIATNIMEKFSQGGVEPIYLLNSDHFSTASYFKQAVDKRNTIRISATDRKITRNSSSDSPLAVHSGSNYHVTLHVDRFYIGSGVGLLEDLFNKYRSNGICPSNAYIADPAGNDLNFDLADDMVVTYKSGSTSKLVDLHKKLDDVDATSPGPSPEYYKDMADANVSSGNYVWDTFTSEYLYGLSKSLKSALKLNLLAGFNSYSANYASTGQPYDVRIGIRPWDLSTRSAIGCNDNSVYPLLLRPSSKYDRYIVNSSGTTLTGTALRNKHNEIGYKLDKSLSSAKLRSDVGLKLFVEVSTRSGVGRVEKSCKSDKLFAYANSFSVPSSRRPMYVDYEKEIKDGSNNFIASSSHPLGSKSGLNIGYNYGASGTNGSIPTKPDGTSHTTKSDYATEATLSFRNVGRLWRNISDPTNSSDDEEDFRGVFLCGFEKNRYEDCIRGSSGCTNIAGLNAYRPFGTNGMHKLGIIRHGTEYGSRDGAINSSRRWDLCENFKLSSSQSSRASLIASSSGVDDGKLELELNNLNVSGWPNNDKDADYRVRFKLVDEYGNDYLTTESGQIQDDDYTEEHRFFTYNCTQFGNEHASGSYQTPPRNCGVINSDPNLSKYQKRIDNPFYNSKSDCEHRFNLLLGNSSSGGSSSCVKLSNIRIYNGFYSDSIDERTGPRSDPIRDSADTDKSGVVCDYWVEKCVKDGTLCVQCGKGYMKDYPYTAQQSCHGGLVSLGGVTCYKRGVHCCNNDYSGYNCSAGGPCASPGGCGFNHDPTCGAECDALTSGAVGCRVCDGATPCNTSGCYSCSYGTAGVCQYKCSGSTPYCDGSGNCVECLSNSNCGGSDICCSYSCKSKCSANANNCESCSGPCASAVSYCTGSQACDGSGKCCSVACNYDSDCGSNKVCVNGGTCSAKCERKCNPPCNTGEKCCTNLSTPACVAAGTTCCNSITCHSDSNCSGSEVCLDPGTCDSVCCDVACSSDSDCSTGEICKNPGECASKCEATVCTPNSSCGTCGICKADGSACDDPHDTNVACTLDSECPKGQECKNPGDCKAKCENCTIACNSDSGCTAPEVCIKAKTCDAHCGSCDPKAKPDCSDCQKAKCTGTTWSCEEKCDASANKVCCDGNCKTKCSANDTKCETCADDCAAPVGCTPTQVCNISTKKCEDSDTCGKQLQKIYQNDPCYQCKKPSSRTESPKKKVITCGLGNMVGYDYSSVQTPDGGSNKECGTTCHRRGSCPNPCTVNGDCSGCGATCDNGCCTAGPTCSGNAPCCENGQCKSVTCTAGR